MESNRRFADVDLANAGGQRFGISSNEWVQGKSFLSRSPGHIRARAPRGRAQSLTKNRERVECLTLRRPETLRFRCRRLRRASAGVADQAVGGSSSPLLDVKIDGEAALISIVRGAADPPSYLNGFVSS